MVDLSSRYIICIAQVGIVCWPSNPRASIIFQLYYTLCIQAMSGREAAVIKLLAPYHGLADPDFRASDGQFLPSVSQMSPQHGGLVLLIFLDNIVVWRGLFPHMFCGALNTLAQYPLRPFQATACPLT